MKSGQIKDSPSSFFLAGFIRLASPYWNSAERWKARSLVIILVILTIGQAASPVMMNLWSQNLFDALEQREMYRFFMLIGVLGLIILGNIAITTCHLMAKRRLQNGWRLWLTHLVFSRWMTDGSHFQIMQIQGEHDNPDGRIAEDIRICAETGIDLCHSLFYCLLLLVSFTKILWSLSGPPDHEIFGHVIYLPGYLVWLALVTAICSTGFATFLSAPLVRAVNRRQSFEANFRFGLVHARENSEAIALIRGEERERKHLNRLLQEVGKAFARQTRALLRISVFTSGYDILKQALPILIASPRYISGSITLGSLMQTAQAFQQMELALSWPIDNLSLMAGWRASVERILSLDVALQQVSVKAEIGNPDHIVVGRSDSQSMTLHNLVVHNHDGAQIISRFSAEIKPGEHILLSGDQSATVTFFKVVAELWPWGRGEVMLPKDAKFTFVPERPYLPAGTLRASISYPASRNAFSDGQIEEALHAVQLDYLFFQLDERNSWSGVLTVAEQQRLGFARLLLHRPDWIFLQESTDALDIAGEEAMMSLMEREFPKATILTIGYRKELEKFHQRKLALIRSEDGMVLINDRRKSARSGRNKARAYGEIASLISDVAKSSAKSFE